MWRKAERRGSARRSGRQGAGRCSDPRDVGSLGLCVRVRVGEHPRHVDARIFLACPTSDVGRLNLIRPAYALQENRGSARHTLWQGVGPWHVRARQKLCARCPPHSGSSEHLPGTACEKKNKRKRNRNVNAPQQRGTPIKRGRVGRSQSYCTREALSWRRAPRAGVPHAPPLPRPDRPLSAAAANRQHVPRLTLPALPLFTG